MQFEGEEVDGMTLTVRQYKGDYGTPLTVDEVVTLTMKVRVTDVSHRVNQRDGRLLRVHTVKIEEVE